MRDALTILGGGPAGLAAGHYAARHGLPFTIFEAGPVAGGNCRTLTHGPFRYDTGAHRFHDKFPEITADIRALLGDALVRIDRPSEIHFRGKRLAFPLAPVNLLSRLGPGDACRAVASFLKDRSPGRARRDFRNFADFAIGTYGRFVAERFLIGYSEKLWGVSADRLSPAVSGGRLSGLTLRNMAIEAIMGRVGKSRHLDGSFYYPKPGIGAIPDALARALPEGTLRLGARVDGLVRDGDRITAMRLDGGETVATARVVSTLPIDLMNRLLGGAAPRPGLHYRNIVLVVLFLDRPRATAGATVYFPEPAYPFTRISEPKNRSAAMAPDEQTCLAAEIPCFPEDATWTASADALAATVSDLLCDAGFFQADQVIGHACHRLPNAYPVLDLDSSAVVAQLTDRLEGIENLHMVGRNGRFAYVHVHDLMAEAKALMTALATGDRATAAE